jgi:hypothetical protein
MSATIIWDSTGPPEALCAAESRQLSTRRSTDAGERAGSQTITPLGQFLQGAQRP